MGQFSYFSQNLLIQARGRLLDLSRPVVMAVVNLSLDSFYSKSTYRAGAELVAQVERFIGEGAAIIDLGAASSRPGARELDSDEEWEILAPALKLIRSSYPETWLSVDTFRAEVARKAALEGCDIINDISGGVREEQILVEVAAARLPFIIMHMRGTPATMSIANQYTDMVAEILDYFDLRIAAAKAARVGDLILDPGFGFSKVNLQNYDLLASMHDFRIRGYPLLAGVSRKSMISTLLGTNAEGALNGTTAVNVLALLEGASILRVHDVREAVEAIKVVEAYTEAKRHQEAEQV